MSYKDSVEHINNRYDKVIEEIKKTKEKYQESINILNKMSEVEECNVLKKDLIRKQEELDLKIEKIKKIQKDLLDEAIREDKKEENK